MQKNLDLNSLWEKVLEILQKAIDDSIVFDTFFRDSKIYKREEDTLFIIAPSAFALSNIQASLEQIDEAVFSLTEARFKFKVILEKDVSLLESEAQVDNALLLQHEDKLNKNFTFANFVEGSSNRESYHASITVANSPGTFFNPLFIFGNSGLGKTHLLHSIGNMIKNKNANKLKILYVTSEEFFNDYIAIIKKSEAGKTDEWFNQKYRDLDVLLLDDIQFLSQKEKSNEVFFNIYNDLFSRSKQIVITSDKHPSELNGIEKRLVSRFSQGLSVGIDSPEFELAYAILQRKLEYSNKNANESLNYDEALWYIASHYNKDVRHLEGALNRLLFYNITFNKTNEISMDFVQEAFKGYEKVEKVEGDLSIEKIKKTVASYYNLTVKQLTSNSRQRNIAIARHVSIYLTRNLLDTPYEKIGDTYGGRDHSTIMSSCNKIAKELANKNTEYIKTINDLKELLKS